MPRRWQASMSSASAVRRHAEDLFGGGVDVVERPAALRFDELATDQEPWFSGHDGMARLLRGRLQVVGVPVRCIAHLISRGRFVVRRSHPTSAHAPLPDTDVRYMIANGRGSLAVGESGSAGIHGAEGGDDAS